eukprot:TRINITY_DN3277_c0_g1_i8.p1 TRINITY_DN3277_c0_g1~~TRINITY_DN3277_c0_g1_i8.p1  ORF type:complete len:628 (-),score=195.31 TRINITY_DN3277_c0_g1_i8:87-1949(-)
MARQFGKGDINDLYRDCIRDKEDLTSVENYISRFPEQLNVVGFGTLLHFACIYDRVSIVQYLLSQQNIDTDKLFDGRGYWEKYNKKTPFQIAQINGNKQIIELFESRPKKSNSTQTIQTKSTSTSKVVDSPSTSSIGKGYTAPKVVNPTTQPDLKDQKVVEKKASIQSDMSTLTKTSNDVRQEKEVLDLKNSITELKTTFEEWKQLKDNEVATLKSELIQLKKEKDNEVEVLKSELAQVKKEKDNEVKVLKSELTQIKDNEVGVLKSELAQVKKEKDNLKSEISSIKKNVEGNETKIESNANLMEEFKKSKDKEIEILKKANEDTKQEMKELNKKKDEEISSLNTKIDNLKKELLEKLHSFEIENFEKDTTFPGQSLYSFIHLNQNEVPPPNLSECLEFIFPNYNKDDIYSNYYEADMSLFKNVKLDNEKWRKEFSGLEIIELESIYLYTIEIPSNKNYQIYSLLNTTLTSISRKDLLPSWKYYLHHLFNGFKKLPVYDITHGLIYRGVGFDLVVFNPEKYQVGKKISFYAFSSCTTNETAARDTFAKGSGTLFIIKSCISGKNIAKISAYPHEDEVLFPPGATFTIVSISSPKKDEIREIEMIQISSIDKKMALLAGEK